MATLRSPGYLLVLVVAAVFGAPIALLSYGFLELSLYAQGWLFTDLSRAMGFGEAPIWWPLPVVTAGGFLVGLVIRWLPGRGGESPVDGFKSSGAPSARDLPGIATAALVTLAFGAVLGPEAPLIALGSGIAAWGVHLLKRDAPAQGIALIGAAGSFAAISTLLGSPLLGAFLLMEVAGLGGATVSMVLVPGLLASGIGALVFIGLDSLTGLVKPSLTIPDLPPAAAPTVAEFGWALVIGVAAAVIGTAIRSLGATLHRLVEQRLLIATSAAGLVVALLAVSYDAATPRSASDVLFSGQVQLGPLISNAAEYSAATLLLLLLCKGLAYAVSMSAFRGGSVFPAMFLGAAGGLALSHLPGLATIPAAAMGIGAMCVSILGFPLVSVLLATLLLLPDGVDTMPLVIVSVVVAYVGRAWLSPETRQAAAEPP
ncbi:MAG TPA: chloride channel protein [Nocardioidaceae bacterium]|nr:chloride channel protein [Nocardioidaceae bacterium]